MTSPSWSSLYICGGLRINLAGRSARMDGRMEPSSGSGSSDRRNMRWVGSTGFGVAAAASDEPQATQSAQRVPLAVASKKCNGQWSLLLLLPLAVKNSDRTWVTGPAAPPSHFCPNVPRLNNARTMPNRCRRRSMRARVGWAVPYWFVIRSCFSRHFGCDWYGRRCE